MTNQEAIESFKADNKFFEGRGYEYEIERNNLAIKSLEQESLWISEKARKPENDVPVLVVNDDGLYAIAIWHKRIEDWDDEWQIMHSPHESDVWTDSEHGRIKAWCELPNIPTYAPFSVDPKLYEDAVSRKAIIDLLSWRSPDYMLDIKKTVEFINNLPSVQPRAQMEDNARR